MKNPTWIVIVTYNAMPWIDRCLHSTGSYPVVVVDNASSDETVIHIQTNFPKVLLLPQQKNLGFGQGNNAGISFALKNGADQVLLLNQDAYLVDNCLEVLIHKQQENPQFGVLSPIHLNGIGDALDYNFKNFIKRSHNSLLDVVFLKSDGYPTLFDIDFVNAACWLISKDCLKMAGGFNPFFFQYGEDRDYVNRVLYHNYKVGVVSNIYVKHDRIQSDSKKKNKIMERLLIEVKLFDLNTDSSVNQYTYNLKKRIVKNLIKFNLKEFNKNRILYFYFNQKKTQIGHFKNLLNSKKEFLFIDQK